MKFIAEPNHFVKLNPPIQNLKFIKFDKDGFYVTENEKLIKRMMPFFKSIEGYNCKHCNEYFENKSKLFIHYRAKHREEK